MLKSGQILSNRYEVIEPIGKGGIGAIYKCYDKNLNKYMAIKTLITNNSSTPTKKGLFSFITSKGQNSNQARFLEENRAEVNILKSLRSNYIPIVYDFFIEDNQVYTVMEFIEGSDFSKLTKTNVFSNEQVIKWANQLCDAVEHLHTRKVPIIHSDIKPANLMLTSEKNVCLIDFNISKVFDKDGTTTTQGTKKYAPPEQLFNGIIDERSDIYSMGSTLYNIVTGNAPQRVENGTLVQELHFPETVNRNLKRVIEKCMQKNPDNRYQTVSEMRQDLNMCFISDSPIKNSIGNSSTNICNMGLATIQGDWIYYASSSGLVKSKLNTTKEFVISTDIPKYINIIGDYIYYINSKDNRVYSVRTDGEERKLLVDSSCIYLSVIGDSIFYIDTIDNYSIHTLNIKTTENKGIILESCGSYCIYKNRIFFTSAEHKFNLVSTNLMGSDLIVYDSRACGMISEYKDTLVYKAYDDYKYILCVLSKNNKPTSIFSEFGISDYNIKGNTLYIISDAKDGFKLYSKSLKHSQVVSISNNGIYNGINIVDNYMFCNNMLTNDFQKISL